MPEPAAWRYQKITKPMFDLPAEHRILTGRVLTMRGRRDRGRLRRDRRTARSRPSAPASDHAEGRGDRDRRHDHARPDQQPRPPGLGRHPRPGPPVDGRPQADQRLQGGRQHAEKPARRDHDGARPGLPRHEPLLQAGGGAGHLPRAAPDDLRRRHHPDRRAHLLGLPRGHRAPTRCAAPCASRCRAAPI